MTSPVLLTLYCLLILAASLAGGVIPSFVRLTHRRLELALSFVSGVMFGVALLHLLPHAILEQVEAAGEGVVIDHELFNPVMLWLLGGFLAMFVIERSFSFHHHEAPSDADEHDHDHGHSHGQGHTLALTWTGAAIGLTLHTLIAGIALAASVASESASGVVAAGLGTFLVIFLHKPFDSLTIGTLMVAGRQPARSRHLVNGLFSLAVPVGVGLFFLIPGGPTPGVVAAALAFSAGAFLCIALSDLLPELQFHRHDRVALTVALLLGLALAWGIGHLEG